MREAIAVLSLLMLLSAAPVAAQEEQDLVLLEVSVDQLEIETPVGQEARFVITVRDVSLDDPSRVSGAPAVGYFRHQVSFDAEIVTGSSSGWILNVPVGYSSGAGTEHTDYLGVRPTPSLEDRTVQINLTVRATGDFGEDEHNFLLRVGTPGFDSLSVIGGSLGDPLQPREIRDSSVTVRNNGVFPRMFHMELEDAQDCGLTLVPTGDMPIPPRTSVDMPFTVRAPGQKVLYLSEDCPVRVTISDANDPGIVAATSVGSTVNGMYFKPEWVMTAVAAAVAVLLLLLLVRRRKEAIEEEILGKPQKPWTIPVERVYLEHLEARDPRAAYVVRHFLMEEEYASSLLWYRHYKQTTHGQRSKEALVVRQERRYERFKSRWQKRMEAPIKEADRFEAKLQKKLDRQAKAAVRKDRRNWRKLVSKIEKAHAAQELKANAKWEKAAAKAERKGQPAPPRPELLAPDLPEEPQLLKVHLAHHKWSKKAARFRKRMIRRQGDMEVRFEKRDARMLHRLRRKVNRIARKLDDPSFVEEHPLLAQQA